MFRPMRRIDKQMSNLASIKLLERGREGVLGTFGDNDYPYTTVVNYVYYKDKIYFHSAKTGHKIDNIKKHDKVSFTVFDNVQVIGEDLNTLYQSVTIFGKAKVLDANADVLLALIRKYSDLDDKTAEGYIAKEIDITAIVEITIDHMTGKIGK